MKTIKRIILLVLLFSAFVTNAQHKPFQFGFKGGINAGWFATDTEGYSNNGVKVGGSWGFVADFYLMEHYSFTTGFNVLYLNGSINSPPKTDGVLGKLERDFKTKYIELPLIFTMKTKDIKEKIRIYGQIGFGLSFLLTAKSDDTFYPDNGDNTIYLPFWRIKAKLSGIKLESYADLITIANLPRVIQSGWNDIPFRFWIPAFKVRPKVFLHLATHTTLSQPRENLISKLPDAGIYPTTLPIQEAVESLKLTLADFVKPRRTLVARLRDIQIDAKSYTLVFIPFTEGHHEFRQPDFQLTINKNVLALSKNL